MAGRSALRLIVDLAVLATVLACGVVAFLLAGDDATPPIPATVCMRDDDAPRYSALLADDRVSMIALFGQIEKGSLEVDPASWSHQTFEAELVARGFVLRGDHYELVERGITYEIDVVGPADLTRNDQVAIDQELAAALPYYEVVYYNGHEYDGTLKSLVAPRDGYRVVVLDSCWSTQRYSAGLAGPTVDVVGNTERAVTGSIGSFLAFLDGLRARAGWHALLEPMNALAVDRATRRAPVSKFDTPEHYRRDVRCP